MSTDTRIPPLFTQHMQPLRDRLDDEGIVAYARASDLKLTDAHDPRIAAYLSSQHGLQALYGAHDMAAPSALLSWPDGSLGPLWLTPGRPATDCLIEAYRTARECLEAVYAHNMPAAPGAH